MRKIIIIALLLCINLLIWANPKNIVTNLKVYDVEYDDGSGLLLKWKPLPKSSRTIEYRVYRGISKDSLFYLGKIDVDATVGVVGDEMQFFDKDFRPFIDIESPGKIRKEKGQLKDSPIYRALPRDVKIIGPMLDKFSTLAVIPKNEFFYKSKMLKQDKKLLAGLKPESFDGIYANVLPGEKYYYTVIAVDEKRTYHPYAPIVTGISYDNTPAKVNDFFVKFVKDKNYLQFEFEAPLFVDDIASFDVYMLPKSKMMQFSQYKEYQKQYELYIKSETLGLKNVPMPTAVQNPAILIHSLPTAYPYPTENFGRLIVKNNEIINETLGLKVPFNPNQIDDYAFVAVCKDYYGMEAIQDVSNVSVIDSSILPVLPKLTIRDKPYDKGDIVELMIGRPIVYITQINASKSNNKKLIINYDILKNELVKVKKVKFSFYNLNDQLLGEVTEHFFDNIIHFNLPKEVSINNSFKVKFSIYTNNKDISEEPYLTHFVTYNTDLKQLQPDKLMLNDESLMDYRYLILKKSKSDQNFRIAKRLSPLMNSYDDSVPYELHIFKGISSYDANKRLLLFDATIDLGYDEKLKTTLQSNLFLEEMIKSTKDKIDELKKKNDPALQTEIDYYQSILDMQQNNEILKQANALKGNKRISFLKKYRETIKRTFKYYLLKTDGNAQFDLTEVYLKEESKDPYFFPTSDWFNNKNFPMLIASIIFGFLVFYYISRCQRGEDLYVRPIAGLEEIDNAIGRATEMGRPILFVPGLSSIGDVATLAALSILGHITKKTAEYDTRILVPVCDYIVLPIAQQIVKEAHYEAGRPDTFDPGNIFFVAEGQFAYVAGVNGVMVREKTATNFYMGMFYAEALLMTETGNATGAVQISGTDALTQIPFFITTCDYTLIGEELYAASAYLAREPLLLGTLKAQDYTKLLILIFMTLGTILSSFHINFLINWFPTE